LHHVEDMVGSCSGQEKSILAQECFVYYSSPNGLHYLQTDGFCCQTVTMTGCCHCIDCQTSLYDTLNMSVVNYDMSS